MQPKGTTHRGRLVSGEVTCSCGWKTGHFALASEAEELFDAHVQFEAELAVTSRDSSLRLDLPIELDRVIALANDAKAALADEHEGNLAQAISDLGVHVDKIEELIENW